jgi:hypothetical protein
LHATSLIPRFRLRTLLLFTFLCALALAIWPLVPSNREQSAMKLLESNGSLTVCFQNGSATIASAQDDRLPVTDVFIDIHGPPTAPIPSANSLTPLRDFWRLKNICIYDWGTRDMHIPPIPFHRGPSELFVCDCKLDRDTLDAIAENLPNLQKIDIQPNEHTQYSMGTFTKILSGERLSEAILFRARLDSSDLNAIANSRLKSLSLMECSLPSQSISFLAKSKIESFEYWPLPGDFPLIAFKDCVNIRRINVDILSHDNRCLDELVELKNAGTLKEITIRMPFNHKTQMQIKELKLDEPRDGMKITINK